MTETIHQLFHEQFPDHAIVSIDRVSESRYHTVWKVTLTNSESFAVKHHLFAHLTRGKPYDLLKVEQRVNARLIADGVSTPPIITTAFEHSIYEWWGDHTLDDICQTTNPALFTDNIIKTICALEKSFHNHTHELAPHVAPGCTLEDLQTSWQETTQSLCQILHDLMAYTTGRPAPSNLLVQWTDLINNLANAPPALGLTDYNARNIVFSNTDIPAILELAKIGWDWPERRLVQYTTSLGAHHPTGHIVGLLTPSSARDYANAAANVYDTPPETILARLDGHHLILHLVALHTCLSALSDPDHPWKNIEARLKQHTDQIVQGLSDHPPTLAFRKHFQTT
jgi:hypothetical protein